jgi:single-stranded-DNA-specific exonuclease
MPSRWVLPDGAGATEGSPPRISACQPDPSSLAAALGIALPAASVLVRRGLYDPEAARRFLHPSFADFHDPFLMLGMREAAARIHAAVERGEKILVYGDYDVDGVTSVVTLVKAIELCGGAASYHVPHRLKDGYGMREEVVESAAANGVRLIVSVDTGIRAAEVVERANQLGIDVIVTDHHLPEAALPPAFAILNPNQPVCPYPEKNLCGAGVVFKLAQALFTGKGWPESRQRRLAESFLKLAAIATVADVVPLTGENRTIVALGLAGLHDVRNGGLRALLDIAGFTGSAVPSAGQVAFRIAPRLNAAGRMDTAQAAVELFLTPDMARARDLARQLHEQNAGRQQIESQVRDFCERDGADPSAAALVYYAPEWHRGVLGIVAGRMAEHLHRPVFVLAQNPEDGLAQGSGRSIPAFHLLEALESMPDLFVRFGGHSHAAGVSLDPSRVGEFRARLNAYAAARLGPDDFAPRLAIDAVVNLTELTEPCIRDLFALAPFGHGNPAPLLAALDVSLAGPPVVWKEKHLKVMVRQKNRNLLLKAWNFAPRVDELSRFTHLDLAFQLEEDAYTGWSAVLRDVRAGGAREAAA